MLNLLPTNPTPIDLAWISVTFTTMGILVYSFGHAVWRVRGCWKRQAIAEIVALRQFGLGRENLEHQRNKAVLS